MDVTLSPISKSHPWMRWLMARHYSQPQGFVGRQLVYAVSVADNHYGAIAAGSSTKHLPGRDQFHGGDLDFTDIAGNIVNNTFCHLFPVDGRYPFRNFTSRVIQAWRRRVEFDWWDRYEDFVLGWETLVELPRTGELYLRDGWSLVGQTKGFTCKRVAGKGTDSWSGKREWNTVDLRPKLVIVRHLIPR